VEIRRITAEDFDGVFRLLQQLWPWKELDQPALQQVFTQGLSREDTCYFGAVENGVLIGFISLLIRNSLWAEGPLAYIEMLVVDEEIRSQGVGGSFMEKATEVANSLGCKRMELESANHRERAHAFYKRLGFESRALFFSKKLDF
jgi:ribosomal protein S18 acetylase RimI-like enzyme